MSAELIEREPVFIAAQGLDGEPEEDDEGDRGEGDDDVPDDDELRDPNELADAFEEMRHRHREPWLNEEEEFERSPHRDEEMPDLADVTGGAS